MMSNDMIQKATAQPAAKADAKTSMQAYIKQMQGEIKKALPAVMTPERFTRIVLSALSTNPKLGQTTPQSFLAAMMTAAQLGMEPNTPLGQAYLIPFYNNKTHCSECQFQLGYKGLIDLAYRSGEVSIIQAQVVYEHDSFNYSFGLEPVLKHIPAASDRGESTYVYKGRRSAAPRPRFQGAIFPKQLSLFYGGSTGFGKGVLRYVQRHYACPSFPCGAQ